MEELYLFMFNDLMLFLNLDKCQKKKKYYYP